MARGKANKQIAGTLSVSEKTVKAHVSAILMKTGTPLHASLSETLNHSTYDCGMYYYNTGRGDAAQALCLYQVQSNHLINDEGNHDQGKQVTE